MSELKLVVCHECDLICHEVTLDRGEAACCPRCRAKLCQHGSATLDQTLALACTTAILFFIMNTFPLMSLHLQQNTRETSLFGAALAMWDREMHLLCLLVVLTTIVAPALQIGIEIYILGHIKWGKDLKTTSWPLVVLRKLRPWSMVEVFMLGLLVSLVKLKDLADIIVGPAFWSCAALILVSAIMGSMLTPRNVWTWSHQRRSDATL
ncbi:paraquat-inducible protein A [Undibacterium sp. SXout20W]|uniref:paraquat-inducible protein A n=1 Tax=Undibacterium sp. SXout20W TaxID=3413051 RepID=UPI003BF19262